MMQYTIGSNKHKVYDGDRMIAWCRTEEDARDVVTGLNLLVITRLQAQVMGPSAPVNPTLAVHPPERASIPVPAAPPAPAITMKEMRKLQGPTSAADCSVAVIPGH